MSEITFTVKLHLMTANAVTAKAVRKIPETISPACLRILLEYSIRPRSTFAAIQVDSRLRPRPPLSEIRAAAAATPRLRPVLVRRGLVPCVARRICEAPRLVRLQLPRRRREVLVDVEDQHVERHEDEDDVRVAPRRAVALPKAGEEAPRAPPEQTVED